MNRFKNKKFWLLLLCIFLAVSAGKWFYDNILTARKTSMSDFSQSLAESRHRGILVAEFQAFPATFEYGQKSIIIIECWLEEYVNETHFLVWIPYTQRTGSYQLCFRIAKHAGPLVFFESFRSIGDIYLKEVPNRDYQQFEITNVKAGRAPKKDIHILLKRK
jgi:hypothetical protein